MAICFTFRHNKQLALNLAGLEVAQYSVKKQNLSYKPNISYPKSLLTSSYWRTDASFLNLSIRVFTSSTKIPSFLGGGSNTSRILFFGCWCK